MEANKAYIQIFINTFNNQFQNKLSQYILNGLSSMLAIDFALRYKEHDLNMYALRCIANLNSYLDEINNPPIEDNINDILKLFLIAIKEQGSSNIAKSVKTNHLESEYNKAEELIVEQILQSPELSKLDQKNKIKKKLVKLKKIKLCTDVNELMSSCVNKNENHHIKISNQRILFAKNAPKSTNENPYSHQQSKIDKGF